MNQTIKGKIRNNKDVCLGTWISLAHPSIAEIMCNTGYEWVCIDLEHSSITLSQAEELIRVIDLRGKAPLVRLSSNDPIQAKRIMDMGAHGIIVPMINSKEEALKAYQSIHYPPEGVRGVGLARAQKYGTSFLDYRKWVKEESIVIVQIEHIDAVNNLEDILSLNQIDGFIIGPYDLTASMGIAGQFDHPDYLKVLEKILDTAKEKNVAAGIHIVEPDTQMLDQKIEEGFKFIAYSVDMRMLEFVCSRGVNNFKK